MVSTQRIREINGANNFYIFSHAFWFLLQLLTTPSDAKMNEWLHLTLPDIKGWKQGTFFVKELFFGSLTN